MQKETRLLVIFRRLGVIITLVVFFVICNNRINQRKLEEINLGNDSWKYAYQVDSVSVEDNRLLVDGWFFKLGKYQNVNQSLDGNENFCVLLERLDSTTGSIIYSDGSLVDNVDKSNLNGVKKFISELVGEPNRKIYGILAEMEEVVRYDVDEYFKCEFDYSKSGFRASFKISDIDLNDGLYRVVFKTDKLKKDSIQANAYIYRGKLSYTNPVRTRKLNVDGTDLEDIVNKGTCLLSRADYHCDLYQYDWKLYWIVDNEFDFRDNGTYIQYQLSTTQFERLPNYRTDNGWYWSNIGFLFEDYEVTELMNCGEYRVSVRDIPNGFSINAFETGYFEKGDWVWIADAIRPYYDFSSIPQSSIYGYLGDDVADWLKE